MDAQGERGDWTRRWVMDPAMLAQLPAGKGQKVLDVGCGEGRFGRILRDKGFKVTGIDPVAAFIYRAREDDPISDYQIGDVENLAYGDNSFDGLVSYLTIIDFPNLDKAMDEMVRVLKPGGWLLVAQITPFTTTRPNPWIEDETGQRLHVAVDNYFDEVGQPLEWRGIKIFNYHRPMSRYIQAGLTRGLALDWFDEPKPISGTPNSDHYMRVPYGMLLKWRKL